MHIVLTPQIERVIREKLESGRYFSPLEVIRDALWLLSERDKEQQELLEQTPRD